MTAEECVKQIGQIASALRAAIKADREVGWIAECERALFFVPALADHIAGLDREVTLHRSALTEIATVVDPVEGMTGGSEAVAIIIKCLKAGMNASNVLDECIAILLREKRA